MALCSGAPPWRRKERPKSVILSTCRSRSSNKLELCAFVHAGFFRERRPWQAEFKVEEQGGRGKSMVPKGQEAWRGRETFNKSRTSARAHSNARIARTRTSAGVGEEQEPEERKQ